MQFAGKHFVVIGAKRSGLAAIELLTKQGARVTAMDSQPPDLPESHVVDQREENLLDADAIVLSPGVPYDLPMLENARARGIPTIGEVELASYFLKGPVIGITGSNGKTTTTALTGPSAEAVRHPLPGRRKYRNRRRLAHRIFVARSSGTSSSFRVFSSSRS